jgi:hypothetical protein
MVYFSCRRPVFLGVGLRKPHMDWAVPQSFFDRQAPQTGISPPTHMPESATAHCALIHLCLSTLYNPVPFVMLLLVSLFCLLCVPPEIALPPARRRVAPVGMPPIAWWNCSVEGPWKKSMAEVGRTFSYVLRGYMTRVDGGSS